MIRTICIASLTLWLLPSVSGCAQTARGNAVAIPEVLRHLDEGGVVVTHRGKTLYEHRGEEAFVPASTLKIATALAAIHHLGLSYRFKTEIYQSPDGDLIVRGYGDPFLISEEWQLVVDGLVSTGALRRPIRHLFLDTTAFDSGIEIPGLSATLNPYDALGGALVANFNTVHVEVSAGGKVRSAEEQTPLTPLARELAAGLAAGRHRINISRQAEIPTRYAGELAAEFLERAGHPVTGRIATRALSAMDRLVYTHRGSRSLGEVVAAMMKYSNNFIANQILLTLGLELAGEPASLDRGVEVLRSFLREEIGLGPADFTVVEGSGISRQNRFTPAALARVVTAFHPYRDLLTPQDGVLLKTGTLTGVYSLAGFLPSEHPLVFVILLNQPRNTRDRVLGALKRATASKLEPLARSASCD